MSKISAFPASDALDGSELVPVVQGGVTKKSSVMDQLSLIRFYPSLIFFGEATDEQVFGYFLAHAACKIIGMQISAQEAPTGAALTVDLVNGSGVEQTKIGTLADGAKTQQTLFGTALTVAAGTVIKGKIKTVGSGVAGNGIVVNLICQPN